MDVSFTREGCQFQESDIGNGQAISIFTRLVDCGSCLPGDPVGIKGQPDDNVRVEENHFRFPQSSRAGEMTSPATEPLPRRKWYMSPGSLAAGTSIATGLPRLVMTTVCLLA